MEGAVYVSGDKRNQKILRAGESHVDVLKGIDLEIEKENLCASGAVRFREIHAAKHYWRH